MELKNVICETPEQFHAECEKWAGKGVVRGRKLIAYGETVAEFVTSNRGGYREGAGRPKQEGDRHTYTIADDVHKWIMAHGGGKYITDTIRVIIATQGK